MSVVFFGTPEFAVPSLRAIVESGELVLGVVTRPDKRRGRGGQPEPSPVKAAALEYGIKVREPLTVKEPSFVDWLRGLKPEFLVVVAYGRILSLAVLAIPSIAPVNLHASLLPKYRGASPITWAIVDGEKETGVSTMFMTFELDEGDILLQERMPILDDDTTATLSERMSQAGGPLLVRTLAGLRARSIRPVPQEGPSNYARQLTKEDGHMDWDRDAAELARLVRGLQPWPGAYCFIGEKRIKVTRARAIDEPGRPGFVERITKDGIMIGAGRGMLEVLELQLEGKRPMNVASFLNGHQIKAGQELA